MSAEFNPQFLMVTFATDRPGGFEDAHIASLSKLLPILALGGEIRMKNR